MQSRVIVNGSSFAPAGYSCLSCIPESSLAHCRYVPSARTRQASLALLALALESFIVTVVDSNLHARGNWMVHHDEHLVVSAAAHLDEVGVEAARVVDEACDLTTACRLHVDELLLRGPLVEQEGVAAVVLPRRGREAVHLALER